MQAADQMQPADARLFQLATAFWTSKCLALAADFQIADKIHAGMTSSAALAEACSAHEGHLYRVLRALAAAGVLEELPHMEFALTEVGELLRSGIPGTMNGMVRMIANGEHYRAWESLPEAVRTGGIAMEIQEGVDCWTYFRQNAARGSIFNEAMTNFSRITDEAVADAFSFGEFRCICDVGGGHGGQLAAILRRNPQLKGILFDQSYVVASASTLFEEAGVSSRAEVRPGDFFNLVASGADVYIAKNVIHDWDDEKSIAILRNIRAVIPPQGRLLLLELTVGPPNLPDPGKFMDVNMLAMTGGRERTREEFAQLYTAAGFRLLEVRPTRSPIHLVIGEPV